MSEDRPLTSDEASDAQSLEDILRQMTLDQYPRFPSIVEHIARHFVNLHQDERRYILAWLRELIWTSLQLARLEPLSSEIASVAQSLKDNLMETYARLSDRDPSFLTVAFEIERWFSAWKKEIFGRGGRSSPLGDLARYIQFMFFLKEVRGAMSAGRLDLPTRGNSRTKLSEEVDPRIRDVSRFVIFLYGFCYCPKPTVDNAVQRIRNVYLAFSCTEEAKAVLNQDEFIDYDSVWEESTQVLMKYGYGYDKEMSSDTLNKLSMIAEPHEKLMQLLMEIPWFHLQEF